MYRLDVAERERATQELRLGVPSRLEGPLDSQLPPLCRAEWSSLLAISAPDGAVAVVWRRSVDHERFERINPDGSVADPGDLSSMAYRVKGTDKVYPSYRDVQDIVPPGRRLGVVVLRSQDAGKATLIDTSFLADWSALGGNLVWFWHEGNLYCVRSDADRLVFAGTAEGRLSVVAEIPMPEASSPLAVFGRRGNVHVFGVETYYRPGEPPPCFGGSASYRYWHRGGVVGSLGSRTAFRDYYGKWRRDDQLQVIDLGDNRFGLLFQDHSWDLATGFESHPLCYQAGLLDGQRRPAPIANVRDLSRIVGLPMPDGGAAALWMEQIVSRNRPGDIRVARLAASEMSSADRWTAPFELARGENWNYETFAAASTRDGKVVGIWRDGRGCLAYIVRTPTGRWGKPVVSSLRIGPENQLVALPDSLILVTLLEGNLYWCKLPFNSAQATAVLSEEPSGT